MQKEEEEEARIRDKFQYTRQRHTSKSTGVTSESFILYHRRFAPPAAAGEAAGEAAGASPASSGRAFT
jgi:hypothetical protein